MSFYRISNSLKTLISSSQVVSRSQPTRILQAAHFKLLRYNASFQSQSFHSTPQNYSVNTASLYDSIPYCVTNSTPQPAHLQKVYDQTIENYQRSNQMVSQLLGQYLTMLCKVKNAKNVLEIGCFTGYSALCFAEGIKGNGAGVKIVSCEKDPKFAEIAKQNVKEAGMSDLIEIKVGDARETLKNLDGSTKFDLIFIDADKSGYVEYYETILERNLLADNGIIVADNVLFQGFVSDVSKFDPEDAKKRYSFVEPSTILSMIKSLDKFNVHVSKDPRTKNVLVPAFDGLMMIQKN